MSSKRFIYVVSLAQGEPMAMTAGYTAGQLHIIKCDRLVRNLAELKKTLPATLEGLRQKGFIVLVDEVMPVFSKYGRPARLSDIGPDGRPLLVSALETYRNMLSLQAITFPDGGSGRFDIPDSIVDESRDSKGATVYNIDWSELKAESAVLLLAVNAATQDSLFDQSTALDLMKALGATEHKPSMMSPFHKITKGYDTAFLSADVLDGDR